MIKKRKEGGRDGERERERSAKNRRQGCEEKAEGKTSLTIYYVGCQLGAGCSRNEFIKYFIRAGKRESRSDARGRGMEIEWWQVPKRERTDCTKGHPFLRNNPLRDAAENARVTPTWLRAQALSRAPPSPSRSHDYCDYTVSLINATCNYDISTDIESVDNPIIEGCKVGRDFKVEVTKTIFPVFPVTNGK